MTTSPVNTEPVRVATIELSIASSVASIFKPPADFRSVLKTVPVKSKPSPAE